MAIELILASGSPRRRDLLQQLGLVFRTVVSDVDERVSAAVAPGEVVQQLALRKAEAVAGQMKEALLIGADTIVVWQGERLGKPADRAQAKQMLQNLQGDVHQVYSGIALVEVRQGQIHRFTTAHKKTDVTMRPRTIEQIDWYLDTGEPFDKAGSYGIQGYGACLVDKIDGCYCNVVGMSLALLTELAEKLDYDLVRDFA